MKDFAGKFAVVTGGGTGMGRELARQLIAEGCSVAMCDVSDRNMRETIALCESDGIPQGAKITAHVADVSDEAALIRFRDEAMAAHDIDKLHLLFNNAGIGGGGSMVVDDRGEWERTFNVCWGGVYLGVRTFLPALMAADEAHIVNTSSVNGFWASLGPHVSHTAYAAAKFAVKGFTEALVTDLRLNAPHVKCSVVMPGHIGTAIAGNSRKVIAGHDEDTLSPDELARARKRIGRMGLDADQLTDDAIQAMMVEQARRFLEDAPMTAAAAATVILDGVKAERWRILVGDDAHKMDELVRADPEQAYEPAFFAVLAKEVGWQLNGIVSNRKD
ncbi:MAG: SDR family NAD(P)-dependent oxidoreductase [Alphaproteobacteria bacterium]|nr:SDR family NAD(P)-dependent oxidoreductase [Alphaproteobacteria bacterium]MBU1515761.1 SDR family NAD(P)-dependent oxidoreductase [Alphaproteobacteria bacterium]MBU2097044.1 SDR family NAD(P)-dependent oxidoreductase [Alphaproteobacteria bacterium]MBU2149560.1 SDR family NAD(P)-dependent oxidoreductase [Alphaproteobacteria bacterium]MBU2308946.1 SDR family NAD(P)-dependent oxidoreductase [Alphaproteobacteria bacterium]